MNKVILIGRLTRDPDVRYSQGDSPIAVARYTLAVDRRYHKEGEQSADFISCIAFGRLGEFAERWLHQGSKIAVVGRIQTGSYTNQEGRKVYTTDVVVEEQEFAESKAEAENHQGGQNGYQRGGYQAGGQGYQSGQGYQKDQNYQNGQGYQNYQGRDIGDGFVGIPDGVDDEGLPFN